MTDLNERIRSSMADTTPSSAGSQQGWDAITATAARRRSRRRFASRAAFLLVLVCVASAGVALATSGGVENSRTIEAAASGQAATAPGLVGMAMAVAAAVGVLVLVRTQGIDRRSLLVEIDRPSRYAAALGVVVSLAIPGATHLSHLNAIDELDQTYPAIPGLTIIERNATTSPFSGSVRPTITLRVVGEPFTAPADEQAVIEALSGIGFRPAGANLQIRELNEAADRSRISTNNDGSFDIEVSRFAGWARSALPLISLGATYLLAISSAVFWEAQLGRRLGAVVSVVTGIQVFLVARAMWKARSLLNAFESNAGPFDPGRLSQSSSEQWSPQYGELHRTMNIVAGDVYPLGSWSALLLAVPWIAGAVLASSGKRRILLLNAGLVCIVAVAIGFADLNRTVTLITD